MIVKIIYKNNWSYIDDIDYVDYIKDNNMLILKGRNIDMVIEKIQELYLLTNAKEVLEHVKRRGSK